MSGLIDLRSDTVTVPSAGMRKAMAEAEVGDDVYGEDPTVRKLEERVAELTGKADALFVPSGTMANQISILCSTQRGDEMILGEGSHCAFYESGAAAAWAGVQPLVVGSGGLFSSHDVEEAIKPSQFYHPRSRLVVVENTHNRAGGRVFPLVQVLEIASVARAAGLRLHLDGARIWNASVASDSPVPALTGPFDTVAVCFSKGLGAPMGSAVCGSADVVEAALRFRKMLGGSMRQAGIVAAGALYALEHNLKRLGEDHESARQLAAGIADVVGVTVTPVETNIVAFDLQGAPAATVVEAARRRGVLVGAFGPSRIRLVTHLNVSREEAKRAATILRESIAEAVETSRRSLRPSTF